MKFQQDTVSVNKNEVQLLSAGSGRPLLFLHGAGTASGFDFALPWSATHRVLIPMHPGWEGSGDDPSMTSVHDYVMHYLEFIDQMGFDQVDLVGLSMGGRIAAQFTAEHRRRVRRLVLVAPAGLDVPGYPLADLSKLGPEELLGYLTENVPLIAARFPANPSPEWLAERARANRSFMRLLPSIKDTKFTRWLHRINVPSMVVWGEKDRTTPVQQLEAWTKWIPSLQVHRVPGGGHLVLEERPEAVEAVGRFLAG